MTVSLQSSLLPADYFYFKCVRKNLPGSPQGGTWKDTTHTTGASLALPLERFPKEPRSLADTSQYLHSSCRTSTSSVAWHPSPAMDTVEFGPSGLKAAWEAQGHWKHSNVSTPPEVPHRLPAQQLQMLQS